MAVVHATLNEPMILALPSLETELLGAKRAWQLEVAPGDSYCPAPSWPDMDRGAGRREPDADGAHGLGMEESSAGDTGVDLHLCNRFGREA
jgi:hypothetical protein